MNAPISSDELSRIDKLLLDKSAVPPEESRRRRELRGLEILVGDDVKGSYGLQLALLTATNLGAKCFACRPTVWAASHVWSVPCLVSVVRANTLADAIAELGGKALPWEGAPPRGGYLLLGDAVAEAGAIRVTYDGWSIAVGPATELGRMAEGDTYPLAGMAAAAVGLGEVFAEFAKINVAATRRIVRLSLWRPDLPGDDPRGIGEQLLELPLALAAFGLGHLGQAYLWGVGALPYEDRKAATLTLCDNDRVEFANIETGALLTKAAVGRLKTRAAAEWLEDRGFSTKLIERFVDENFRRTEQEPVIALSGFDDNWPRRWLSRAGFAATFDSGLGGEARNFDTIGYHAWPNPRAAEQLWPVESQEELGAREMRRMREIASNAAYESLAAKECGRLMLANRAVAVPFVGAMAASIVLAEMLKAVNGGPNFSDLKARVCSPGTGQLEGRLAYEASPPLRGVFTQRMRPY